MINYRKCNIKSKFFVKWCIRTQFVGPNGYRVWTGKKRLTEEGGSQIIFVVKLKTLSYTREEAEQHREQLEPAAGFGESCGVGHGHEELGWWEIVLSESGLGSAFRKVFPASVVQPHELSGVFILVYSIPSQTGPSSPK